MNEFYKRTDLLEPQRFSMEAVESHGGASCEQGQYEQEKPSTTQANRRDVHLNPEEGQELAKRLVGILDRYSDQRVLVLAPPCAGKSTLLQHIPTGIDMDTVFDTMPVEFRRYVLHHEYPFMYVDGDRETIKYIEREYIPNNLESDNYLRVTTNDLAEYTNEQIKIVPGRPVFGTSLIETDVIVHLRVSDEVLDARLQSRNTKTHRALQRNRVYAIRRLIEEDVERARGMGVRVEEFLIFKEEK